MKKKLMLRRKREGVETLRRLIKISVAFVVKWYLGILGIINEPLICEMGSSKYFNSVNRFSRGKRSEECGANFGVTRPADDDENFYYSVGRYLNDT